MTYLLAGAVVLAVAILAACTHIYITPKNETDESFGVSVQSSNSTNILGSQNVQKDDTAGRGAIDKRQNGDKPQSAEAAPTAVLAPGPKP